MEMILNDILIGPGLSGLFLNELIEGTLTLSDTIWNCLFTFCHFISSWYELRMCWGTTR